jgi:hypothetical protein
MYNYYSNQYPGYTPYYARPQVPYQPSQPMQSLPGKVIDNLEAVKAVDVLLDGTIGYYPLADGSAIVSKQLQQDGTSKIVIYKPAEQEKQTKYVTENDLEDIKKEIEELKKKVGEQHESNATN